MTLGELISVARECKGWSQRDLEKASGVSNPLISQIETGKVRDPGFTTVVRLVDALGLSLDRAATNERARLKVLRDAGVWRPEQPDDSPLSLEVFLRQDPAAKPMSDPNG
jgi:transcriptional regulator with XRE-family HTH domain